MRGIDISNWQAGINLQQAAECGIDFCICKATESDYFVDAHYNNFIEQCKHNDLLWGFYHFAGHNDPIREAEFFYDNCKEYFNKGIPVLDYEIDNPNNAQWCESFISRLHELTGIWAMIYISAYRIKEYSNSWIPDKCGLWIAGYPYPATSFDQQDMPYNIGKWKFAALWQFTSSLHLDCWNGNLDGNFAYMTADAWNKYASSDLSNTRPIQPILNYIDLCKDVMKGNWGVDQDRHNNLQDAGYDPNTVQCMIDDYYDLANEIIKGKYGNGQQRKAKLQSLGYDYELAQMIVNSILL